MKKNRLHWQAFAAVEEISQARLLEKIEKKGPALVIPYGKCFQDGLTLVVHEDTSLPGIFF